MKNRILDLNVFALETLDIKLPDDPEVLHISKPTREQVIKISQLEHLQQEANAETVYERLDSLVLDIINSNEDKRKFDREYVEQNLNVKMRVAIIQAFSARIGGIEKDPN